MAFINYRKETSERSDATNWAKKILIEKTGLFFDAIEGCNENDNNVVTHLFERARVDFVPGESLETDVLSEIILLETPEVLQRKINFANTFNCPLTYVLYCNEKEAVWVYTISDLITCKFIVSYNTYHAFSDWIYTIKGWRSTKPYREREDLPYFDKALRRAGCAWPTNIDCFVSNQYSQPIAILEFQNANNTEVAMHCNNDFFLGKHTRINQDGYIQYDNDVRRWQSQEILRVQSGLRLFIITWSQKSTDFILKEVDVISFPNLPFSKDWTKHGEYQRLMHEVANTRDQNSARIIANQFSTYKLSYAAPVMSQVYKYPSLSAKDKSFPYIYYKYKNLVEGLADTLPDLFLKLID